MGVFASSSHLQESRREDRREKRCKKWCRKELKEGSGELMKI